LSVADVVELVGAVVVSGGGVIGLGELASGVVCPFVGGGGGECGAGGGEGGAEMGSGRDMMYFFDFPP